MTVHNAYAQQSGQLRLKPHSFPSSLLLYVHQSKAFDKLILRLLFSEFPINRKTTVNGISPMSYVHPIVKGLLPYALYIVGKVYPCFWRFTKRILSTVCCRPQSVNSSTLPGPTLQAHILSGRSMTSPLSPWQVSIVAHLQYSPQRLPS